MLELFLLELFQINPFTGDAAFATGPFTQIDELAALAAKRPEGILRAVYDGFTAGGAFERSFHKAQHPNRNSTDSSTWTGRRPAVGFKKRMVKRCLPALISAK